LGPVMK